MVCLITGSSRGLGRSVALSFGRRGHKVVVHYKDKKSEAEKVASEVKESIVIKADVTIPEEVGLLVDNVISKWGMVDVLVNNAGITKESLLLRTSEKDFDDVINTNLKGPFHLIRAVLGKSMKKNGGHIINVSSYAGIKGKEGLSAYSAAKAGLIGLTKTSARELAGFNIMVNAVLPGYMLTDMGTGSGERGRDKAMTENLLKEYSDPDTTAEFICNLAETRGITGQVFNLDSRII